MKLMEEFLTHEFLTQINWNLNVSGWDSKNKQLVVFKNKFI